jgi:predicted SAM-dependent methyltransferase
MARRARPAAVSHGVPHDGRGAIAAVPGGMSVKSAARRALIATGLYPAASRMWMWLEPRLTISTRAITGRNARLARDYLGSTASPRLHIGCGDNHLAGWLNTELTPRGDQIFLDATRPFPFADGTFAMIYTEHMIEHIPYADAQRMIAECYRVLRPGGTIRVVTPDLAFLRSLLDESPLASRQAYFDFYRRHNGLDEPFTAVHLVNHFVRAWGHQFIYDRATLTELLKHAGFEQLVACAVNESRVPELNGLAKLDRMPDGFVAMESLTVEGCKSSR